MTRIYKKTIYRPIPASAKFIRSGGKRYAVWEDANGNKIRREIVIVKNGERTKEESPYFVVRYHDAAGRLCERSTGCKERRSAEHKLNQWLQDIEKVKAGILTQDEFEVGKRQQFGIDKHLEHFQEHLKAKGATARYIRETCSRIVCVCTACKFHRLADMNAAVMIRWLNKQGAAGMGARTRNSYREVMMTFANWAVSDNSLPYNPFNKIPKVKESIDRRHERRALTPDEVERLLQAAEKRPLHDAEVFRKGRCKEATPVVLTAQEKNAAVRLGLERKLLYATFIYTGLRKGELASITAGQVFLDAKIPHIVLQAKHEKNRRGSTLPLHPELVKQLRQWLKSSGKQSPSKKLFNVPTGLHRILDRDLMFAGIEKRDTLNRVIDVHSLRHTHATLLAQNGVSPGVAKSAMRHSDIRLTMNVYSHLELNDVANAVNQLPDFLNGK